MQNVNLYLPELRPRQEWVTAWASVSLILGFVLVLLVATLLHQWSLSKTEVDIAALEQQVVQAETRVRELQSRKPAGSELALDARITQFREQIRARVRVNELIEGQSLGNREGYSGLLMTLATKTPEDLRLTRFHISKGAALMEVEGETTAPERLAEWIAALQAEPEFADTRFGEVSLSESASRRGVYRFALGFESVFAEKKEETQ